MVPNYNSVSKVCYGTTLILHRIRVTDRPSEKLS